MKRVLCIWLPGWPLQRLRGVRPELKEQPLALYAPAGRGQTRIAVCSPRAGQRGVALGMPLAEAQALGAAVHFEPHDPQADREALRQLALACQRFSPLVAIEEAERRYPDPLVLEREIARWYVT